MTSKGKRSPEQIGRDLRRLRPRVLKAKERLDELYSQQNALMVEGYEAGMRVKDIGEALDIGEQAVRFVLRRAGVERRAPGPRAKGA